MAREPMVVGGCTFNRWKYATSPLVSAGVEDRGVRIGARFWPVLQFGFLGVDRSLVEFSPEGDLVLIPWRSIREVRSRRSNQLTVILLDGWTLRFDSGPRRLDALIGEARVHLSGSPQDSPEG